MGRAMAAVVVKAAAAAWGSIWHLGWMPLWKLLPIAPKKRSLCGDHGPLDEVRCLVFSRKSH